MGGPVILWLRPKMFHVIIKMSQPLQSLGGIALVTTQSFGCDRNFCHDITLGRDLCPFLSSILTESRHQLLLRLQFLSRPNLCRDLVCICLKFNEHIAFHSLSILKFSASMKSIPHSNSNIYSIYFSKNLYREKNAPPFSNSFFLWIAGVVLDLSLFHLPLHFCTSTLQHLKKGFN